MADENPSSPASQKLQIEVVGGSSAANQQADTSDYQRMTPEQFKSRLTEAEEAGARRLLKAFGVPKDDRSTVLANIRSGKYALANAPAEGEPDYRAEFAKLKPALDENAQLKAKIQSHSEYFKRVADEEFAKLPEPVQKDIVRRKIEDPEARLSEIQAMKESGLLAAIVSQSSTEPRAASNPATTMAIPGPRSVSTQSETHWQQHQKLMSPEGRPTPLSAAFRQQHAKAIEASRPK